jgi:PEP-CTERM motif
MLRKSMFACLVLAGSMVAGAAPIDYTISFLGAGTLDGNNFTARTVTFGFTSDTTQIMDLGGGIFVTPDGIPATYDLAGFSTGTLTSLHLFDNETTQLFGINPSTDFLDLGNAAYATYDLTTAIGPISTASADFLDANGIATNNGQLIITSARDFTVTAELAEVPEPSTFPLIVAGLALLGLGRKFGSRFADARVG